VAEKQSLVLSTSNPARRSQNADWNRGRHSLRLRYAPLQSDNGLRGGLSLGFIRFLFAIWSNHICRLIHRFN